MKHMDCQFGCSLSLEWYRSWTIIIFPVNMPCICTYTWPVNALYSLKKMIFPFSWLRHRAHGGCDWSPEDIYSSMARDPTIIINYWRDPCLLSSWFIGVFCLFYFFFSILILNTVCYNVSPHIMSVFLKVLFKS